MRIGLLNNLRAGRNRKGVAKLLHFLVDHPEVARVETSSAQAVPDALWDLAHQDVELLVVNGGDGTLSHVLGEILGSGAFDGRVPHVAVLRGGRTNMSARDLGSQRDPVRAMASLVWAAQTGRVHERAIERPVLRVQYGPGFALRYGMFFGAGVIHRGIELVHRRFRAKRQGMFGASLVTSTLLARLALLGDSQGVLAPDKVGILVDGMPVDRGESTLVMATSLNELFLGLKPFWGDGDGDGGVRFTSIAADARGFGRSLPRILSGRPGETGRTLDERNGYLSRNAQRVDLRMDCGFTVDGELEAPAPDRIVSLTADTRVPFVRA
jgi:diacylglycerol kinase (ATP)